jgi:hypothetical protein
VRNSLALAACLALATAACEPARREVQVNWTFGGGSCSAASVATIEIDIDGEYLSPNQFSCSDATGNLTTGADLGRFLAGGYYVTVTGFAASGNPTYQTSQQIFVHENQSPNVFAIDVQPYVSTGNGQGDLILLWTFGGASCSAAGVSSVNVSIDGTAVTDFRNDPALPCNDRGTDGVEIGPIPSGSHAVTIGATSTSGVVYSATLSATIADNIQTTLTPNLIANSTGTDGGMVNDGGAPDGGVTDGGTHDGGITDGGVTDGGVTDGGVTDGGVTDGGVTDGGASDGGSANTASANVSWSFAGLSCSDAIVTTVTVYVDGSSAGTLPCSTNGSDSGTVSGIASGTHGISIAAVRGTGGAAQLVYQSTSATAAMFIAGTTTHVIVSAPATSPGTGGATLNLTFPSGGPSCSTTTGAGTQVTYTLTSPAGVAQSPQTFTCGGSNGASAINLCNPGAAGCGAGNAGLAAGTWHISAAASGYSASSTFPVPNDAVDTSTVSFTAN